MIQFIFDYSYQIMRVGFFGKIAYQFTYINLRYKDFWKEIEKQFGLEDVKGVH